MSILTSTMMRMIVIPLTMILSLTACSSSPVTAPESSSPGGAATVTTQTVTAHTLAVKKYKMSTVKKHHTKGNCWTVIGKNVYKLTSFVKKHPGGAKRIIALCGKNGTAAFRGQHGTGGKANSVLKKYKIGVLA